MNTVTAIISGATGYLGSHLALELLRAGGDALIVCLARGADLRDPQWRVMRALEIAARTSGVLLSRAMLRRIQVLDANPLEPVPARWALATLPASRPRVFWHCAASVRFTESVAGELLHTNAIGTTNALGWADRLGCSAFHHVSTAFVAGAQSGAIAEVMADEAPPFVNAYEASKFDGEQRVRRHCDAVGMPWRVFRPSIIVGDSRTHLSGSDAGMYRYVQMISEFWQASMLRNGAEPEPLRVWLPSGATSNIVPVDICAREMLAVAASDTSAGGVFHIVGRDNVPCRHLFETLNELTPIRITTTDDAASLRVQDLALAKGLAHYAPYLVVEKSFSRTATLACAGLDLQQDLQYDAAMARGMIGRAVARYARGGGSSRGSTRSGELFARQHGLEDGYNVVGAVLAHAQAGRHTGVAISDERCDVSYGALPGGVHRVAGALNRLGAHAEQRIAVIAVDGVASALVILGIIHIGAVVVRINPMMQLRQIRALLAAHAVQLVLADDAMADALRADSFEGRVEKLPQWSEGGDADQGAADDWLPTHTSPHDAAIGVFTSGSTGQPQLVLHSHLAPLVAAERYGAQVLDIKPSDILFSASRLSFAFGLQNLFLALLHGARAVLAPERVDAMSMVRVIRRFKPSIVFAVPTVYQMVLEAGCSRVDLDVAQIRAVVSAGEPLPPAVAARWKQAFGLPILDSLGSSEVFSTYLSNLIDCDSSGATGKMMPGFDALLCDESGQAVADGVPGVMWIRGPSVIAGYPTGVGGQLFRDEWFCTNDVFHLDDNGYYHYSGRRGDMFKVAGQWVSPIEVELVLLGHPRVREAAVVASSPDAGTARPQAYVVVTEGPTEGVGEALQARCLDALGRSKQPHRIVFVRELPRTLNGKLRRLDLRAGQDMQVASLVGS